MSDDEVARSLPRRRATDRDGAADLDLILYQLSEMKGDLKEGFARMEGRFDRVEDRIILLERFRERTEARERALAEQSTSINHRWVPIALGLLAISTTIALFVLQGAS